MAKSGDFSWPPAGTSAGRDRGLFHGHGQSQSGSGHLAPEDGHLVAEHDDFDGQVGVVGSSEAEDLHGPEEGEIQGREGHGPFSPSSPCRRKPQIRRSG